MNETESQICPRCGREIKTCQNSIYQLQVGSTLANDRYEIGCALGQGGFGITYIAYDRNLDIPVAIKEYFPMSVVTRDPNTRRVTANNDDVFQNGAKLTFREAQTIAKLGNMHNVVRVYNVFHENNTVYIVMEYVEGETLTRRVKRDGAMRWEDLYSLIRPLLNDLNTIHSRGLIHRDISPDNIMIRKDTGVAVLLDFGAARKQGLGSASTAVFRAGYSPVEQYSQGEALDDVSDEYSMCATLYYVLTGKTPETSPQRATGDRIREIPGVPVDVEKAILRGMSVRREDRFPTFREMTEALEKGASGRRASRVLHKSPDSRPKDIEKSQKSKKALLLPIALVATVIVVILYLLFFGSKSDDGPVSYGATAEPTVTSTPIPTATPEPTNTSTSVPTATPEPTYTPTPSPTVTPEPTYTPTLEPTVTPKPTYTPTPAPTATPEQTYTPTPKPTYTPTPSPKSSADDLINAEVGSYILFGSYEQDNDLSNGKEPIEWLVLAKEDNKAYIVSRYGLDCQLYDPSGNDTWETSSIRQWLNGPFIDTAFSKEEQYRICTSFVAADKSLPYTKSGDNDTIDKVFLLSIEEFERYFDSIDAIRGTDYCFAQGAFRSHFGFCWWWLRSPSNKAKCATGVGTYGTITLDRETNREDGAVRPALWIRLEY